MTDQIKKRIIREVKKSSDENLLDLIYELLLYERKEVEHERELETNRGV